MIKYPSGRLGMRSCPDARTWCLSPNMKPRHRLPTQANRCLLQSASLLSGLSSSFGTFAKSSFQTSHSALAQQSLIDHYRARREAEYKSRNKNLLLYAISIGVVTLGLSYAAVPLYRVFCSVTGYNGTPLTSKEGNGKFAADRISQPVGEKSIKVRFNANKSDMLDWKFWPCQKSVTVKPGETVLAFYKAKNLSDSDILGVATYNVTPAQVAPYFAKVECFCFDEQRLLAGEEVDLPVFFFIDKDFVDDPFMKDIDDVVLSYTFFKARRNSFGFLEPDTPSSDDPNLSLDNLSHGLKQNFIQSALLFKLFNALGLLLDQAFLPYN
ncbi:hypothetical protein O181_008457 [Austropuccinia psidii MF-1]|uniref:Cytochrome c oxidase assembly protein COX11, mitochondrial n=1 Tax=Austropuccinia psidii MF-1 TaxID=1389203 RepID=A0A9Q3BNU3_9BASI|nr:hypothetical protein [Austropuccinia psidii MF-1]